MAARRRRGGVSDVRADPEELREAQRAESRGSTTSAFTRAWRPARPIRSAAIRTTCPKRRATGRSSTSSAYHSCIQPNFFLADTLEEVKADKLRGGVPNISWTTEYAQLVQGLPNCYAEIGTTWASSVVTFPTIAAHIMGQLMKFMGEDRIVFGSDSVWYGSPQWQIEAFWRFQIPEALREKYGYPELTESAKRKILGLNSAKLYGIQAVGHGLVQARSKRLRVADDQGAEDAPGVWPVAGRQHVQDEGNLHRSGHRAGPYPLRVDAGEGLKSYQTILFDAIKTPKSIPHPQSEIPPVSKVYAGSSFQAKCKLSASATFPVTPNSQ